MRQPKLIITADDYGMSPRFNAGVLKAIEEGIVSGISVMIKRKYIRSKELLALGIPLGLHLELNETSPEVEIQIHRFKKRFGQLPDYLDGHQHKHLHHQYFQAVVKVAKKFDLPVRSRFAEDREALKSFGIRTPDNFISWHPDRIEVLEERLTRAKQYEISELVIHPGYFDPACHYPYNQDRESELAFLHGSNFRKLIHPFQLIQYTDLTDSSINV